MLIYKIRAKTDRAEEIATSTCVSRGMSTAGVATGYSAGVQSGGERGGWLLSNNYSD